MKQWKLIIGSMFSVVVLGILGIFIHQLSSFTIEESALKKHITEQINRGSNAKINIEIEEVKDIGNFKTLLLSIDEGDKSNVNEKIGFAFYEKNRLNKYRFDGLGWGTNSFDSYLFKAFVGKKKEKLLVVFGKKPSATKEFERFTVEFEDEVFVANLSKAEYFLEVFPVSSNSTDASRLTNISFGTNDYYSESFPLIITSKIK
ncbi:hypothetical protein ACFSTH_05970 [Paenibacillus yanchengensis]|uniref:Uncharacterized protein n=1 Tax=Paenibacillus yanchengensis TaxID=2035833 RepID=A0ABW4YHY4_9BACL